MDLRPASTLIEEKGKSQPNYDRLRDFLTILSKGIKTSLLYPPENPIPREFKNSCWQKLSSYLTDYGAIELDIELDSFRDRRILIFKAPSREENLPGILHRDGIRHITFRDGLQKEEWLEFYDDVLTVIREGENYEDLVNLFWQRDFRNIEYVAVDDFTLAEITNEYVPQGENSDIEYSDIVFSESQTTTHNALDLLDPDRSDSDGEPTGIGEFDDIFSNIKKFSQDEKNYIDSLIGFDEELIIEFEAIDLLIDVLLSEKELSNFDESLDTISKMFDKMLEAEQFPLLVYLIKRMKEVQDTIHANSSIKADKFKDALSRTGDRIRISRITNLLNHSPSKNLDGIRMYLEELDWDSLPSMIWMLGELEYFPARRMVIEALANKGRERIDIIGNAIYDSRWYVIRNAALILGEIGSRKGISYLKKALEHFDERVRWEAVAALEKVIEPNDLSMMVAYLEDDSERIRRKVLELLSDGRCDAAFDEVCRIVSSSGFEEIEMEEQKNFIMSLASIGGERAIPILKKIVKKITLFSSAEIDKRKEAALTAIASIDTPEARKIVENIAGKKKGTLSTLAQVLLEKRTRESSLPEGKE